MIILTYAIAFYYFSPFFAIQYDTDTFKTGVENIIVK